MSRAIVLRPEPGASATVARAAAAGLDAVAIPLFEIVAVDWAVPDAAAYDALLLTSANAVRLAGPAIATFSALPAYCVGPATAEAARDAGLVVETIGEGNAASLIDTMPTDLRLLHLTGIDHRPIDGVTQVPVYHSRAIDPPPALDPHAGDVAMVHSPRAGRRLAEIVADRLGIAIAAISPAAATACGCGWRTVQAAATPRDGALLALAAKLCQDRPS